MNCQSVSRESNPRPPLPLLTGVALIISGNMRGGEVALEAIWARHFSSFLSADQSNLVVFGQFVKERESTRLSVSSVQPWINQVGRRSLHKSTSSRVQRSGGGG